jgi:dynein heavy chain 1, cytosolic
MGVKKAVSDLEVSLLHLQQDIDIPEISLVVHPPVKQIMGEVRSETWRERSNGNKTMRRQTVRKRQTDSQKETPMHMEKLTSSSQVQEKQARKATVEDFSSRIEDTNFLTALSKSVARWVREIQKVSRLDRDPSTGTAMQEVRFPDAQACCGLCAVLVCCRCCCCCC